MQELIQSLTRAANAIATYYEKAVGPEFAPRAEAASSLAADVPVKTRKPRAATPAADKPAAEPVAPVAAANPNDDILGPAAGAGKVAADKPAEMSEEESDKQATARAKTLMQRFSKIEPLIEGKPNDKPEGYLIAKKLMADHFRVARIADMVHAQRVQFIVLADAVLAKGGI